MAGFRLIAIAISPLLRPRGLTVQPLTPSPAYVLPRISHGPASSSPYHAYLESSASQYLYSRHPHLHTPSSAREVCSTRRAANHGLIAEERPNDSRHFDPPLPAP